MVNCLQDVSSWMIGLRRNGTLDGEIIFLRASGQGEGSLTQGG